MQIPPHLRNPRSEYNLKLRYWDTYAQNMFTKYGDADIRDTILSRPEKLLLRAAFQSRMPDLLPVSVLWRGKEAFSDGVSGTGKSWFEIIKDRLDETAIPYSVPETNDHGIDTKEKLYYRSIFCHYKSGDKSIPYTGCLSLSTLPTPVQEL